MDLCNRYNNMDYEVAPTLFMEFHGSAESVESQAKQVGEIAEFNGGSEFRWAREMEERNRLWKARHEIYWTAIRSAPGCRVYTTDVCVPITKLPDLIATSKADILSSGITGTMVIFIFLSIDLIVIANSFLLFKLSLLSHRTFSEL